MKHISLLFIIFIFVIINSKSAHAAASTSLNLQCKDIFTSLSIDHMIEDLSRLYLKLELAKTQGSSSLALTALKHDYSIEEQRLFSYLETHRIMTQDVFKMKMKSSIMQLQTKETQTLLENNKKKEEQKDEIKDALDPVNFAKKMIFHDVRPGKFKISSIQNEIEITTPFAMMSTPVTQLMWSRLKIAMGEKNPKKVNPSYFKNGNDSTIMNIDGIPVQMKPDYPVEQVSWIEAKSFIDGLNYLSVADDTKVQKLLKKIIPDHIKGDIYDFPTSVQWQFVMRNRGQSSMKHFDRDNASDITNYAWFSENSGNQTHAVATLQPRVVDGNPFYDLEGNVWEWCKDWEGSLLVETNQPSPVVGEYKIIHGGFWNAKVTALVSYYHFSELPATASYSLGIRLVRTRPQK